MSVATIEFSAVTELGGISGGLPVPADLAAWATSRRVMGWAELAVRQADKQLDVTAGVSNAER
jgi:hypothetical protein